MSAADEVRGKVRIFVRQRFDSAMALLRAEQEAKTNALKEDLGNRGLGFALDPLDPRFDDIEVTHCNAVLQAKADALLDAYEVYGLPIDDLIMKDLNSHQRQLVDASTGSIKATATSRALRTGKNTAPGIARAEALGREIERSTHAYLKSLACEVEKRRQMSTETPKERSEPSITFHQNNQTIIGNPKHVAQVTQDHSGSFSNAEAEGNGKLLITVTIFAGLVAGIGGIVDHIPQLRHLLMSLRPH
jgi:hypothetical protein